MGWLADRIGVRNSVLIGAVMVALGLALSSLGTIWALYVGQGVLIGFLGMGAIYPPLLIYVSRWFDRRRGTAIALISSGQYIAGVAWPALFERGDRRSWLAQHLTWDSPPPCWCGVVPLAPCSCALRRRALRPWSEAQEPNASRQQECWGCGQIPCRRSFVRPAFAAACRWRFHRRIWWHFAATSASARRQER